MKKKSFGFTIIELIVVIGVLGLSFPALFGILYAILQQQARIYKISEVKRQGDFLLTTIEATVKNKAYKVYSADGLPTVEVCDTAGATGTNVYFQDTDGNAFKYYSITVSGQTYVSSDSARPAGGVAQTFQLTNNRVNITGFSMSCVRSSTFATPLISVVYTVQSYPVSTRTLENVSLTYQTKIKLRSF